MNPTFSRILVPIDFSEHSEAALQYAVALAHKFEATVTLLHAVEDSLTPAMWTSEIYLPNLQEQREEMTADAEQRLAASLETVKKRGVTATATVRTGRAARVIVEFAADSAVDLIVMATRGRGTLGHLVMGSVAESVVRTASCPVLTLHVHTAEEREPAYAGARRVAR